MKKLAALLVPLFLLFSSSACSPAESSGANSVRPSASHSSEVNDMQIPESFVWIQGGSFQMGSPESEAWRSDDETQHTVTVSGYYMSKYELTQKEYEEVMGSNPSNFKGEHLPVENVSWLDAVAYCNARSERDGLTPVYTIDGQTVSWDRSANG